MFIAIDWIWGHFILLDRKGLYKKEIIYFEIHYIVWFSILVESWIASIANLSLLLLLLIIWVDFLVVCVLGICCTYVGRVSV